MKRKFRCKNGHEFYSDAKWRDSPTELEQQQENKKGRIIVRKKCPICGSPDIQPI